MPSRSTKKNSLLEAPKWWVSALLLPVSIPLLIAGDVGRLLRAPLARRRERRFAASMAKRGRLMDFAEFELALTRGRGTVIDETVTAEGPWRLWWTPDDVRADSPYPVASGEWVNLVWDTRYALFFQWCAAAYTDPRAGTGRLVVVPEPERARVLELVRAGRFVTVCSFVAPPVGRRGATA